MNKHILFVIDHQLNPGKYTQEQLEDNSKAAWAAYRTAALTAADAAYATTYWLNEYFIESGENKQDYIDKLEAQS